MWIFLNDAMFSIVEPSAQDRLTARKYGSDVLSVRARAKGDIERVFPDAEVICLSMRDYRYRAFIDRMTVSKEIAERVARIGYSNFKDSTAEDWRYKVYSKVWYAALALEDVPVDYLLTKMRYPAPIRALVKSPALKAAPGTAAGRKRTPPAHRPARQSRRGIGTSPRG